ncbi:MAG: hypothetical protein SGPRY_014147 [Prymnesium sp.]
MASEEAEPKKQWPKCGESHAASTSSPPPSPPSEMAAGWDVASVSSGMESCWPPSSGRDSLGTLTDRQPQLDLEARPTGAGQYSEEPSDTYILLTVLLLHGNGLKPADRNGLSDPFVCYKTLEPVWNAEFVFEGSREWLLGQSLKFDVRDYDGVLFKSEPLGVAQVDLSNLELSHVPKGEEHDGAVVGVSPAGFCNGEHALLEHLTG